jgi:PleD family two-component response regulator
VLRPDLGAALLEVYLIVQMDALEGHDDGAAAAEQSFFFDEFSPAGLRVLVVDDDKLCLRVISKMLQQCSYEGAAYGTCTGL